MGRLPISQNGTVRKNIIISKTLYESTLEIALELGLSYPEYIRKLLISEIKRVSEPPNTIPVNLSSNLNLEHVNYIGFRKRKEIHKIMRMMRRLLWDED